MSVHQLFGVSPDFINWEITVNDPDTWTKPYTFMIRLKKTDALIYEYACHEGNYSMEGILRGARNQEAQGVKPSLGPGIFGTPIPDKKTKGGGD